MQNSKFEAAAKRYPELNIHSNKFNASLALESPAVHITIPYWKAPIYYDIAEFERTMQWKQMVRNQQQQQKRIEKSDTKEFAQNSGCFQKK